MDPDRYRTIRSALLADERLVWSGAPRGGVRRTRGLYGWTIFVGTVGVVVVGGLASGRQLPGPMLLLFPFVLGGVLAMVDGWVYDPWRRSRTSYALTDRRVLKMEGVGHRSVIGLPLASLSQISHVERRDGSGTISCVSPDARWPKSNQRNLPKPLFRLVVDVRHVHALLVEARDSLVAVPGHEAAATAIRTGGDA